MDTIRTHAFADVDLTGKEGYFVKKTGTDERIAICAADTDVAIGVLYSVSPGGIGAECIVDVLGLSRCVFASAVQPFDLIAPDATGKGKTAAAGDTVVGMYIPESAPQATDLAAAGTTGNYRIMLNGPKGTVHA